MGEQPNLLEITDVPLAADPLAGAAKRITPKLRIVDRSQMMMASLYVEELIPVDHKARAIWELAGRLDLSGFTEELKTQAGAAGRPAWDPRLLVSVWVYAYSEGMGSAREIERVMQYEPGLQWLCGLGSINHHSLSDFRVNHKKAFDESGTGDARWDQDPRAGWSRQLPAPEDGERASGAGAPAGAGNGRSQRRPQSAGSGAAACGAR
jgi:transposase